MINRSNHYFRRYMAQAKQFSVRKYTDRAKRNKKSLSKFLVKLGKTKFPLAKLAREANDAAWKEVDCLSCANCCKKMTPTFNRNDISRISKHLNMSPTAFKEKWLIVDDNKDTVNKSTPCQFLGKDNKCSIYSVRPKDCAEFPHFIRKDFRYQVQEKTFTTNLKFCPATLVFVEKMQAAIEADL
jgi:uncharacterized protein